MTNFTYMIGPGISFFRSEGDLSITFNSTRPKVVDFGLKLYDIFIPLLGALVIIVNGVIVVSSGLILYRGQQPRATYLFLGNVAIADLVAGVAVLFGMYYPISQRTETVCAAEIGMTVSASLASVYSIGLIAIDRFLYILYGLRYQRYIYPMRARLMIVSIWALALTVGFLPAMGYRGDTNNGQLCWFVVVEPPELILATTTIGAIPLALIIILYSIILYHALRKISQINAAAKSGKGVYAGNLRMFRGGSHQTATEVYGELQQRANGHLLCEEEKLGRKWFCLCKRKPTNQITKKSVYNPSKWKAIKIVAFTTGCYFISWFPYFLTSALYAMCNPKQTPLYCNGLKVALASPLAILGLSNSLMNPIIYAWWHKGFRETLRKICKNYCHPDRVICNTESSTGSPQTVHTTRSTCLYRSDPESEAYVDVKSEQDKNSIILSPLSECDKSFEFDQINGETEQMIPGQDVNRKIGSVLCTPV